MTFLYFLLGLGIRGQKDHEVDYSELHREIRDFSKILIEEYGIDINPKEMMQAVYSENVFATEYLLEVMLRKKEAHSLFLRKDRYGKHILEGAISLVHIPLILAFYKTGALEHFLDEPLSNGEYLLTALFTIIGLGRDERENELLLHLIEQLIEKMPPKKLAQHYITLFIKSEKSAYWVSVGLALFLGQEELEKELLRLFPAHNLASFFLSKKEYLRKEEIHLRNLVTKMRQKVAPVFEASPIYQEFLKATELEDAFFASRKAEPLSQFLLDTHEQIDRYLKALKT